MGVLVKDGQHKRCVATESNVPWDAKLGTLTRGGSIPVQDNLRDPASIDHPLRIREAGIYWRGSGRAQRGQQECNPNQSFALPSGRQARRRSARVLVGCLALCFLTWAASRFQTPSPMPTESLHHPAPARAVVFQLYWYYRDSSARNETFSAFAGPEDRRRRGVLEYPETTALTRQEIFDKEEQEEQSLDEGFGGNLSPEVDSLKKRTDCDSRAYSHEASSSTQVASSSTRAADLKTWPVNGGYRENDLTIQSLYTKIALGNQLKGRLREYMVQVDTGSGHTWVNCIGSPKVVGACQLSQALAFGLLLMCHHFVHLHPTANRTLKDINLVAIQGPGGLYKPRKDSYLNCKTSRGICDHFQDGENSEQPCDKEHSFRCLYRYVYGDGTTTDGSVINVDLSFDLKDGSKARHTIAIGCSIPAMDDDDEDSDEDPGRVLPSYKDGVLGVGRHPAGLLSQLHSVNLFSEYVTAVCLDHARPRRAIGPRGQSYPMEYTGFLTFGDLYTLQAASTVWTASIIPRAARPQDVEAIYTAKLVGVTYRDSIISFKSKKRKKDDSVQVGGTHLGFDTGSHLTYLGPQLFKNIEKLLDADARRMGYRICPDAPERTTISRKCWSDPKTLRKSLVKDFGELIMHFSSLTNDDTTSDFVIKPEYYITVDVQPHGAALRTCFNMREEDDFSYGNLGAEAMSGHLLLFNERPHQIGWSPVTSCRDLR